MAKGEGVGGCLNDIANASLAMIRCILCMIYIIVCCGPILIIIGIVFLSAPNSRKQDVEKFNKIVDDSVSNANLISNSKGIVWVWSGNVRASVNMQPTSKKGVTEDTVDDPKIKDFTSTSLEASDVRVYDNGNVQLDITLNGWSGNFSTFSIIQRSSTTVTRTVCPGCTGDSCACSRSDRQRECNRMGNCNNADCTQCTFRAKLRKICLVLRKSNSNWEESSYKGCEYPFNDRGYYEYGSGDVQSLSLVKIWAETDPQLQLDLMTKGTRKFGMSYKVQLTTGGVLLALGIITILYQIGIVGFIVSATQRRQKAHNYFSQAVGWQQVPYAPQTSPTAGQFPPNYPNPYQSPQLVPQVYVHNGNAPPPYGIPQNYPPQYPNPTK